MLVFFESHPDTGSDLSVLVDGMPREFVVTDANEHYPMFSPDGQSTPSVELSTPQLLFEIPNMLSGFDIHPDGERFVVVRSVGSDPSTTQLNVILNWFEELKARVPVR